MVYLNNGTGVTSGSAEKKQTPPYLSRKQLFGKTNWFQQIGSSAETCLRGAYAAKSHSLWISNILKLKCREKHTFVTSIAIDLPKDRNDSCVDTGRYNKFGTIEDESSCGENIVVLQGLELLYQALFLYQYTFTWLYGNQKWLAHLNRRSRKRS